MRRASYGIVAIMILFSMIWSCSEESPIVPEIEKSTKTTATRLDSEVENERKDNLTYEQELTMQKLDISHHGKAMGLDESRKERASASSGSASISFSFNHANGATYQVPTSTSTYSLSWAGHAYFSTTIPHIIDLKKLKIWIDGTLVKDLSNSSQGNGYLGANGTVNLTIGSHTIKWEGYMEYYYSLPPFPHSSYLAPKTYTINIVGPPPPPPAPSAPSISGSVSNCNPEISWGSVSGATGYKVYRSYSSGGGYSQIATSSSPFTDNNQTIWSCAPTGPKDFVYYKVKAYNSSGDSPYSNIRNFTVTEGY